MKKSILIITILTSTIFSSCHIKKSKNYENSFLSSADSLQIVQEVIKSTSDWANASISCDGKKVAEFWMNSPNLVFIDNMRGYPDFESIYQNCIDFYSVPIDSTNLVWLKRNILPITKNMASIYGRYEFYCKFSSGEIIHGIPYFTALMVNDGGKWKILRGHESVESNN